MVALIGTHSSLIFFHFYRMSAMPGHGPEAVVDIEIKKMYLVMAKYLCPLDWVIGVQIAFVEFRNRYVLDTVQKYDTSFPCAQPPPLPPPSTEDGF